MRTATTIVRTKDGWKLSAGPDVPADKQRARFNDVGTAWPEGILEVRFQIGDGPAKTRTKEKSDAIASHLKNAEKHLAEKTVLTKKREEEQKKAAETEADEKKKATDDQRAREVKAKADAKAK